MKSGIYKIVSPSGRFYIGSAVNLERRWRKHRNELLAKNHHCAPLQSAAIKYGIHSLKFEVLMYCSPGDLIVLEQAHIDLLRPEYNIAQIAGNLLGFRRNAALRKKHSDAMRKKWQDPEHRVKVSAANTGNVPDDATRAKMSDSAKRRIARDGHPMSKPVICVTTGAIFESATVAPNSPNAQTKISQVCLGKRSTAYGHRWQFALQSATPTTVSNGVLKMAKERMTADARTAQLIETGYKIARTKGIRKVTRAAVARETGVSDGLINRYVQGREGLRAAVLEHAVTVKDAATLAEAGSVYELPSMPRALAQEVRKLAAH